MTINVCARCALAGTGLRFNIKDMPPRVERSLYLLLMDESTRIADPEGVLRRALCKHGKHRLRLAKALTIESPCFQMCLPLRETGSCT
jgi:hypothetical protein